MRNNVDIDKYNSYHFLMKIEKNEKIKIVKSYYHLPLYHHVKIDEKYELLSLYILMIKK